jgi:hypothetical protein
LENLGNLLAQSVFEKAPNAFLLAQGEVAISLIFVVLASKHRDALRRLSPSLRAIMYHPDKPKPGKIRSMISCKILAML